MCTTTDANETIESEPAQEPRDINVLLAMSTYQGMTDEEIDLILEYRIDRAVTDRELLAKIAAINNRQEQCIADNRASAAASLSVLQSIVESEFPTVPLLEPQTFTPRFTEV